VVTTISVLFVYNIYYICVCVCVYICVCIYVCMYDVCVCVCIYVCMHLCMYDVCVYVYSQYLTEVSTPLTFCKYFIISFHVTTLKK